MFFVLCLRSHGDDLDLRQQYFTTMLRQTILQRHLQALSAFMVLCPITC